MTILPDIQGMVAKNADPDGCHRRVQQLIDRAQSHHLAQKPKNVLILGASSGFGLAARIALSFSQGPNCQSLGVSFERPGQAGHTGTAGWHNNQAVTKAAQTHGLTALNLVADAFLPATRQACIELIQQHLGPIDLVIYSLASGQRAKAEGGSPWRSSIKTLGPGFCQANIQLENDLWFEQTLEQASDDDIEQTLAVMGGDDWLQWIQALTAHQCLAPGCQSTAFSYLGSAYTEPLYRHTTLGLAKADLHAKALQINQLLAEQGGQAWITVCKALVTKASVFIPGFVPYLSALYLAMKEQQLHEDTLDQMLRLFAQKLPNKQLDEQGLMRLDDYELLPEVQQRTEQILRQMTPDNFQTDSDYPGVKQEFLQQSGFGLR